MMERDDVRSVSALLNEAGWAFLPHEISRLFELSPSLSVVAERDAGLLGVAMGTLHGELGWLGNVAVKASERGGGIGRRLVEATIAELEGAGAKAVRLASTAVAVKMYERLGFVQEGHVLALAGEIDGRAAPASMRLTPAHLESVIMMDRTVFGADRSRTLRRLLSEFKDNAAATGNPVTGYALLHDGVLGPLVVGSGETRDAEALVRSATAGYAGTVEVAVPGANAKAVALFGRMGFKEAVRTTLMSRGRAPAMTLSSIYSLGGLEKG